MKSQRRRRIAIAGAIALGGIALIVRYRADACWQDMQTWVAEHDRAWDLRVFHRPVLHGESGPGRSFEHYDEAMRVAAELLERDGDQALRDIWLRPEGMTVDERTVLRARWAPAIAAIRSGAHCADARPSREFDAEPDVRPTNLLAGRWVVNMTCVQAREALAVGRGAQAVGHTLDTATFGADLVCSPLVIDQMIGHALVTIATSEFWTGERLAALDAVALEQLARGLGRLDARLPITLDLDGEALFVAHQFEGAGLAEFGLPSLATWSYGFSSRWMIADAVLQIGDSLDRLHATAARPWPEREAALDEEVNRLADSSNPVVGMAWPMLIRVEKHTLRQVAARVRMLRVAIELRAGRSDPALADPLGDGPLQIVETANGVRVTSSGQIGENRLERVIAQPAPR